MTRFFLRAAVAAAFSAVAAAAWAASGPAPTSPPAEAAFVAAYGHASPVSRTVVRPAKPPGCDCSGLPERQVSFSVSPQSLIALGSDRYALVSLETDVMGAHMDPGAISIAYLQRTANGWRLDHRWDELAWTGNNGDPADRTQTLSRDGAPPLLFATRSFVAQGMVTTRAWAFELAPAAPQTLGFFPIGGEVDANNGCDFSLCGAWRYGGAIRHAFHPASLFEVTYEGWREWPGQPRKARFVASAGYREVAGKLMPDLWVPLPDCGGDCANGSGYP